MSEVLRARMRECLTAYQVGCGTLLDVDELAAELLESVLPGNDNDCMDEPLFRALICESEPFIASNTLLCSFLSSSCQTLRVKVNHGRRLFAAEAKGLWPHPQ